MIIETSANQFYQVFETRCDHLAHCWYGYSVKKTRDGFKMTAAALRASKAARPELVRKAGAVIIDER